MPVDPAPAYSPPGRDSFTTSASAIERAAAANFTPQNAPNSWTLESHGLCACPAPTLDCRVDSPADPPPAYETLTLPPAPSPIGDRDPRPSTPPSAVQHWQGEYNLQPKTQFPVPVGRVSSMPRGRPVLNHQYLCLADARAPPPTLCACPKCKVMKPSWSFARHLASRLNTCLAGARVSPPQRLQHAFHDSNDRKHTIIISRGIAKGEIERPVCGKGDWTTDWEWALSVRHGRPGAPRRAEGVFYFNDLPGRLQLGVPWRNGDRTRARLPDALSSEYMDWGGAGAPSKQRWAFVENARFPRWCAGLSLSCEGEAWPGDHDPWEFLTTETSCMAELDQRTGPGRYKKVMWYRRGVGYGNDLEGEPVCPWVEGAEEMYTSFVGQLIPLRTEN